MNSLPGSAAGRNIDFLVLALADIGDVEIAGYPVEAESPGIPQAVAPDLGLNAGLPDKGVVGRYRVRGSTLNVHPEDGSQEVREVLASTLGIVPRASISQTEIEEAVRSKQHLATVVIGKRLVCREDHLLAGRIGDVGIGRDLKDGEMSVSSGVSIVHHEPATGGIVRVECQSQETLLTAGRLSGRSGPEME